MSQGEPLDVVFCVLGPLRVEVSGHEVRIGGVRRRGVLLRLLAAPGRRVPVNVLAEDVWDGDPPTAAVSTLQSHVSALRQAIGSQLLTFADGGYRIRVPPGELDSLVFEQEAAAGRAALATGDFEAAISTLERALTRWRGPAFADVLDAGWSAGVAGHLEEVRNTAVEEALEAYLAVGRHDEVCVMAEEAVAAEPWRERRWAALMLALYRAGRQTEALATYRRLRETLAEELGLDPSSSLSQLEHDILVHAPELDWPGATARGAQIQTVEPKTSPVRTNLPTPVARFVGRRRELAELSALVERERLVTIAGAGGAGKTRLAIEVAAARLAEYRDGVWFIDLAELSSPAEVPAAFASAIGLRQASGQLIEELLLERVTVMQALLVTDNCEHLVEPVAATVERVLEAGAGVCVLATSRQPLHVPGECLWLAPPISFPAVVGGRYPAELASFDAVQLFMDRAEHLWDAGEMSPEDLRLVAEITARLEGLPLAIELAAARAAQLDLSELASMLEDRIGLSWLGSRTAHARHQTLAATIGWSYELLTPPLQAALRGFSVFSGGFTLDAAAAITSDRGTAAETVAALAERSLITADRFIPAGHGGRPGAPPARYRMLETIRQYCAELIAADGSRAEAMARDAHSQYFASLARQASAALTGWQQARWLTTLEADYANLLAAINHLLAQPGQRAEALRMITHLQRFWRYRGHIPECAVLLQRGLIAADPSISPFVLCSALNLAGYVTGRDDMHLGRSYLTESLRIARAANDDFNTAAALRVLAYVSVTAGDLEEGSAAAKDAVELARAVGDPVLLGECLLALGNTADLQLRQAIYQEALEVSYRSGDRMITATSHNDLGNSLLAADDPEAARHHFEEALAIFREVGDPNPGPSGNLGWVHFRSGAIDAAASAFTEALREFELLHNHLDASYAVLGLACCAAASGSGERAARLLGFADRELQRCGGAWVEPERTYREQLLADIQHKLGSEFGRHYYPGCGCDRAGEIAFALNQHPERKILLSESHD